jgi:hypothetical protein
MGAQKLHPSRVDISGPILEDAEELRHGVGIVSGLHQGVDSPIVGFLLEAALITKLVRDRGRVGADHRRRACLSAQQYRRDQRAQYLESLTLGVLDHLGQVVLRDMCDLVRHHGGQLRLVLGCHQQAGVQHDVASRHREGIEIRAANQIETERVLRLVAVR